MEMEAAGNRALVARVVDVNGRDLAVIRDPVIVDVQRGQSFARVLPKLLIMRDKVLGKFHLSWQPRYRVKTRDLHFCS